MSMTDSDLALLIALHTHRLGECSLDAAKCQWCKEEEERLSQSCIDPEECWWCKAEEEDGHQK